ncbi:hypothetical protein ACX8XN_02725 [Calditrichota bacterium GD2]
MEQESKKNFSFFLFLFSFFFLSSLIFNLSSCKRSTEPIYNPACPDTTSHEFTWEFDTLAYPESYQTLVSSIWGSSENDVYAVGHNDRSAGQIWHWDGIKWRSLVNNDSGPIDPFYLRGGSFNKVFGTSKNDVWIVGGNVRGSYPNFTRQYLILHFDGKNWIKKEFDGFTVISVWGVGPNDIWFGTTGGEFIHYDGQNWQIISTGKQIQINSMTGFASDEIYAHGTGWDKEAPQDTSYYYFYKYDGNQWKILDEYLNTRGHTEEKFGGYLWADENKGILYSSSNRVYLWNGENWSLISNFARGEIYGSNWNNIFTASNNGKVYHYNGSTWKMIKGIPKLDWPSLWCNDKYVFISSELDEGVQKTLILRGTMKSERR